MNILKQAYYRTFQFFFYGFSPLLPWKEPKILSGKGKILEIPALMKEKNISSVIIVTDKNIVKLKLLNSLKTSLKKNEISFSIFSDIKPNPTIQDVENALSMYKENFCQGIIAVGGGSALDCAKAMGARAVKPNKSVQQMKGLFKILKKLPTFIAVPTTAGTGSECTVAAIITNSETHHKYAINDFCLIPDYAILSPELTKGLPKNITATTGLDALTHAVEAYLNSGDSKTIRDSSELAVKLVFNNLEKAYADGADIEAREKMQLASYHGGLAFTRAGVGNVHAIAHTLGGFYGVPHGLANAVILPMMLEFYGAKVNKKLAELFDVAFSDGDTKNEREKRSSDNNNIKSKLTDMEKATLFISKIKEMNSNMKIQTHFEEIREEDIPQMADYALKEANPLYGVPIILDKKQCSSLIRKLMPKAETQLHSYTGKIALVDLKSKKVSDYPYSDYDREKYIGAKGMASRILFDILPKKVSAFSAANPIVITTGPLTRTGAPSSARFNVSTISPLTGLSTSSNCGGDFGFALKGAGYDGIIIKGRAENPVQIVISGEKIKVLGAKKHWGKNTIELSEELGSKSLVIGKAGENKVLYAAVMSGERAIGRGGVGAVFGDKNLKAIVVKPESLAAKKKENSMALMTSNEGTVAVKKSLLFNQEGFKKYNMRWITSLQKHYYTGKKCPELGTSMLLKPMQENGQLPVKNFSETKFANWYNVSGERMKEDFLVKNKGCLTCPIKCSRVVNYIPKPEIDIFAKGKNSKNAKKKTAVPIEIKGPELETLGLLGPNLLNDDLELIIEMNYLLDDYGIDTMSCGGTLAYAMALKDQGVADLGLGFIGSEKKEKSKERPQKELQKEKEIRREMLISAIHKIANRKGDGDILADGTKKMSKTFGRKDLAINVKGLELAAYNPKGAFGQGLSYATANRGGCHLNGGYLILLEGLGLYMNKFSKSSKPALGIMFQNLMEAISCMGICLFTSYAAIPSPLLKSKRLGKVAGFFLAVSGPVISLLIKRPQKLFFNLPLIPHSKALALATGMKMNLGKMLKAGSDSYYLERQLNIRQGLRSKEDKLPSSITKSMPDKKGYYRVLPLEDMLKKYRKIRKFD
ncbi:MAG: iron-containing alcohol dehydrogenase [Anaerovoracaceae bacterium]